MYYIKKMLCSDLTIVRIGFQTEKLLKKQQLRHSPDQKRPEDNKHVRLWSKI